jgi:hypothetical protein
MKTRVYIAGPMSKGDRVANLADAMRAMRYLMEAGYAPLMPQLTFFLEPFMQASHADWLSIDIPWLSVAQAVLRLPGESVGADDEVCRAGVIGIPVFYSLESLQEYFKFQEEVQRVLSK